jgi:hypothetical protein
MLIHKLYYYNALIVAIMVSGEYPKVLIAELLAVVPVGPNARSADPSRGEGL